MRIRTVLVFIIIALIQPVMAQKKILAFDIGIKNLAFCILEGNTVKALENCNILEPVEVITCSNPACKLRATYKVDTTVYCKRHIPKTHTVLKDLDGKKLPPNKTLKELVKTHGCISHGHNNADYLRALATKFAMRVEQPKQVNASKVSLEIVHDSLRRFVQEYWHVFTGSTAVLLENQPAFKNPHMKSVQVLLFATLREHFLAYEETPSYHFIHAKKKVGDAPKGDEGYAERKNKSEERLKTLFEQGTVTNSTLYDAWKSNKKKSDMADALCMCVDF
jgi:hypothetical protein